MQENDKALQSFLIESDENLGQLEQDIVALERSPRDNDRIASAFRAIHTIKGTCGFFGFSHLETLSHALEDLLGAMRDGDVQMDLPHATVLLDGVDEIRVFLKRIHDDGNDGDPAPQALMLRLHRLIPDRAQTGAATHPPPSASLNSEPESLEQPEPPLSPLHDEEPENNGGAHTTMAETTVRVDVVLLDKLMNVVGELVLTRNQLLQHTASQNDAQLVNLSQRLNMVTSELQEGLMQTRMQPIRNAWSTYPRLLLDLERKTGKRVTPVLKGGDTELDRSLLEAIRDPLIHLVRNAVDHGIESPEKRALTTKAAMSRWKSAMTEPGSTVKKLSVGPWRSAWFGRNRWSSSANRKRSAIFLNPGFLPQKRSVTCPGAAWAWMWCAPMWNASGDPSISRASPAVAPP